MGASAVVNPPLTRTGWTGDDLVPARRSSQPARPSWRSTTRARGGRSRRGQSGGDGAKTRTVRRHHTAAVGGARTSPGPMPSANRSARTRARPMGCGASSVAPGAGRRRSRAVPVGEAGRVPGPASSPRTRWERQARPSLALLRPGRARASPPTLPCRAPSPLIGCSTRLGHGPLGRLSPPGPGLGGSWSRRREGPSWPRPRPAPRTVPPARGWSPRRRHPPPVPRRPCCS